MGTHHNKIDAKGRVSIPSQFRAVMKQTDARETVRVVLRPSVNYDCLEAWPEAAFQEFETTLKTLDRFSQDYYDRAAELYMDSQTVESDKEGRVALPEALAQRAGVKDSIVFTGMGHFFAIWEPSAHTVFRDEQIARQREQQAQRRLRPNGAAQPAGAQA